MTISNAIQTRSFWNQLVTKADPSSRDLVHKCAHSEQSPGNWNQNKNAYRSTPEFLVCHSS